MTDKERAVQTTVEDMGARVRLSVIRKNLQKAGFAPDEIHEIISAAIEHRKEKRVKREASGREAAVAVIGLGITVLIITAAMAPAGGVYLVPGGLLSYGAYLWYGKPGS